MKETKFKDTELGKIPEEWEVCNLGSIGVPLMCKRIMKWQTNETAGIPFYKIGTFGKQADAFIAPDIWRYMITHFNYPRKGDILISAAGTIGRMVVFDGQPSYFQDSNIVWIDNDEEKVLNPYLEYAYTKITWSTDASTISRLYNNNLKSALILFPHDKAEQQRIASALSDADALVAELDALIEKKLAIMAGTMQELLTGKRRLQGFSESWVERTLEEICLRHDNLRIPVKASDRKAGYTPYYGANGIQDYVEGYTHDGESILIAEDGANDLDNYPVNFAVGKIWVNNHAHVVKAKEEFIYSYFLYLALKQCNFNDVIVGSSRAKLNASSLMQINVKYPSSLAEQRAIASILSDMDAEIAELEAKRDKYKEVRQGMMQQLLTGKIRLI